MNRLAIFSLLSLFLVATSSAQLCTFGAHGTPTPSSATDAKSLSVPRFEQVPIYLVLFSEAVVTGASYDVTFTPYSPTANVHVETLGFGPYGDAFNLSTPGGYNVGFGECYWGFDGIAVSVAQFSLILFDPGVQGNAQKSPVAFMDVEVVNNVDQHPEYPVFVGCSGAAYQVRYIAECSEPALPLTLFDGEVRTESRSFGALKSLY